MRHDDDRASVRPAGLEPATLRFEACRSLKSDPERVGHQAAARKPAGFPRLTSAEVDLARRVTALLGAPRSRHGQPWPLVRALVALLDPTALGGAGREIVREPDVLARDGEIVLLTVELRRVVDGCELLVRAECQVHARDAAEDSQEWSAVELVAWGTRVALDCGVVLTDSEREHVDERVEAARAWLLDAIASEGEVSRGA